MSSRCEHTQRISIIANVAIRTDFVVWVAVCWLGVVDQLLRVETADHADAPIGGVPSGTYRTADGRLVDR